MLAQSGSSADAVLEKISCRSYESEWIFGLDLTFGPLAHARRYMLSISVPGFRNVGTGLRHENNVTPMKSRVSHPQIHWLTLTATMLPPTQLWPNLRPKFGPPTSCENRFATVGARALLGRWDF